MGVGVAFRHWSENVRPHLPEFRQDVVRKAVRRQVALMIAVLLGPASLATLVLALWRIGSDMEWTGEFPITSGIFSHWLVWMSLAVLLEIAAYHLKRISRDQSDDAMPYAAPHSPETRSFINNS